MLNWLLKILDWLRSLIGGHVEKEKLKDEIMTKRLEDEIKEIEDEHDKEVSKLPAGGNGAGMVEYWRNRGK